MSSSSNSSQQPDATDTPFQNLADLAEFQEDREAENRRSQDTAYAEDMELARRIQAALDAERPQSRKQHGAADQDTSADGEPRSAPDDMPPETLEAINRLILEDAEDMAAQAGERPPLEAQQELDAMREQEAQNAAEHLDPDLCLYVCRQLPRSEQSVYVTFRPAEYESRSGLLESVRIPALAQPAPNGNLEVHLRAMRDVLFGEDTTGRAPVLRLRGIQYTFADESTAVLLAEPRDIHQSWLGRLRYLAGGPTLAIKEKLRELSHRLNLRYGLLHGRLASRWTRGNGVVDPQHTLWNEIHEAAWDVVGLAEALHSALEELREGDELDAWDAAEQNGRVVREVGRYLQRVILVAAVTQIEGWTALRLARTGDAEEDEDKTTNDQKEESDDENAAAEREWGWSDKHRELVGADAQEGEGDSAGDSEGGPKEAISAARSESGPASSDIVPIGSDASWFVGGDKASELGEGAAERDAPKLPIEEVD